MRHMGFVTTKIMIIIKLSWDFSVANLKTWTSSGFFSRKKLRKLRSKAIQRYNFLLSLCACLYNHDFLDIVILALL